MIDTKTSYGLLLSVLIGPGLILVLGCDDREPSCALTPPGMGICHGSDCGDNSPVSNSFPVNGLNTGTCKNAQGVWQVPEKVQISKGGKKACEGQTLDVDEQGMLVAGPKCRHEDLVGASFLVRRGKKRVRILIRETATLQRGERLFPGYVFTLPDSKVSLCNRGEAKRVLDKLGLARPMNYWERPAKTPEDGTVIRSGHYNVYDVALAFRGEVYQENSRVLKGTELSHGNHWYNLACARDALARLDLYAIAPHAEQLEQLTPDYYTKRSAGLRMLTANYCNTIKQARYTVDGNELEWQRPTPEGTWGPETAIGNGRTEAVWDENGAVCLEGTRLFSRYLITTFPEEVFPHKCRPLGTCRSEGEIIKAIIEECPWITSSCEGKKGFFRSHPN